MVEFIPAEQLKSQFEVFGHFYSVQLAPGEVAECRSVLEIAEADRLAQKPAALSFRKPDAVFVMMNPGSSRPLVEVNNRIPAKAIQELAVSLVPTKPDTTQYQVMRVMHYCNWRHVRVLNLSDLRCPKSGIFFRWFKSLEENHRFEAHSIFAEKRADELAMKLPGGVPVVRAWGLSPHLDRLIGRCEAKLAKARPVRGLRKEGTKNKFLHPLPSLQSQKLAWVSRMVEQIQKI